MSIFKQMEVSKITLNELEKNYYMLGYMPNELKIIFISGNTTTADELFKHIKIQTPLPYQKKQ